MVNNADAAPKKKLQPEQVSKREQVQGLLRGIRVDIDGYKQLHALLIRQRELMQRRDNAGLAVHNEEQTKLCEVLMERAKKRSITLVALGFTGNSKGMEDLIARLPQASQKQVLLLWKNLVKLVKESQQFNEQNGKLLVSQQEVINSLLNKQPESQNDYGHAR
ncbi:flagellar export chaperone FlgN [uncultured Shewanella sp.]|uniref:flagellar export chaperone FlgN n=1 Tax=uncultured Shewanella sp. TaxID=173975 RepID=UPI00260BED16|nr:flagellar export chaperone FlgN [uncultured Shewanella sp.]